MRLQAEDGGKLGGDVEVDETFIGGKARNMHAAKRKRLGISQSRSMVGKVAVMGLLERHGEDGQPSPHCKSSATARSINLSRPSARTSNAGATIYTDALRPTTAWDSVATSINVIDHAEAYVDGQVHTNGLETSGAC